MGLLRLSIHAEHENCEKSKERCRDKREMQGQFAWHCSDEEGNRDKSYCLDELGDKANVLLVQFRRELLDGSL